MVSLDSKRFMYLGWIFSLLGALPFLPSFYMKISGAPQMVEGWQHLGWDLVPVINIAIVEMACVILYAIPITSVLGAILLTGYLGGVIATHARLGEPIYLPLILGVLIWGGLFLRDGRIRSLIPLRK